MSQITFRSLPCKTLVLSALIVTSLSAIPAASFAEDGTQPPNPVEDDFDKPDPAEEKAPTTTKATTAVKPDPLTWRVEASTLGEYNSNIEQTATGLGDFLNRTTLKGAARYLFPTGTQLTASLSHQWIRFATLGERNQSFEQGTFVASQWLLNNNLSIYGGGQGIFLRSDTAVPVSRFDQNYFLGSTYYYVPNSANIVYGGYQLDRLQAEVSTSRYWANSLVAGYRYTFMTGLYGSANYRFQLRNYERAVAASEQRHTVGLGVQYSIFPWLTVEGRGDYNYVNSDAASRRLGYYSLGLNVIGGYVR